MLVHAANAGNRQSWIRPEPGAQNSTQSAGVSQIKWMSGSLSVYSWSDNPVQSLRSAYPNNSAMYSLGLKL